MINQPRSLMAGLLLVGFSFLCAFAPTPRAHVARAASSLVIQIRRDTSYGEPSGNGHSVGVSTIVTGTASSGATITLTLAQAAQPPVVRTVYADATGAFAVSMDRLIADGDTLQVSDGSSVKSVSVPRMTFRVNAASKIVTGSAPANIVATTAWAPHSLAITFEGGSTHQVTTDAAGAFTANFVDSPFQPGALGTISYVTPEGDTINKPLLAVDPFARGVAGDGWADVVIGQPNFAQISPNQTVASNLFNPGGVYVDHSSRPNRFYIYDAGNSRILGLRSLGRTSSGQACTSFSDYGQACTIEPSRPADIVLGQPSFTSSACNGDSGFQQYPDVPLASATALCGLREEQLSITEGGSGATMATDAQGNLYVPDIFNNRILRYNNPFATDTTADYVWGQADFAGMTCNHGASYDHPSADSLCLAPSAGSADLVAGVALDTAGNMWVTDTQNNRVLRFPFDAARSAPAGVADLVLGQTDFTSVAVGSGRNQMYRPASVRVSAAGVIYVADSLNNRVLGFTPPFANGMSATYVLGDLLRPLGLEFDVRDDSLWVSEADRGRFVRFRNNVQQEIVPGEEAHAFGGLGIDRDGNLMWTGWDYQDVLHFSKPTGSSVYRQDSIFMLTQSFGLMNQTGSRGLYAGLGLEVTDDQLIYGDGTRMLFWNSPRGLQTNQPADGAIGVPDFQTRYLQGPWFERMHADHQGRLWVLHGDLGAAELLGYQLPLHSGATPAYTITSPLPLKGGGSFSWTGTLILGSVTVQPACDCIWLSDKDSNRVFRIRNVATKPTVDVVLGQLNIAGTRCNQGRGINLPARDSLCYPGALSIDPAGNLFVADHTLENEGNLRLLEWDAQAIPLAPASAVFGIPATRVFGRNGDFNAPNCLTQAQDPLCAPWEPGFDSRGHMVVGLNGYDGQRFPLIYENPLDKPLPIGALGDYYSMATTARYDRYNNLYVTDHNRNRIMIYHGGVSGDQAAVPPTAIATSPAPATATVSTATATTIPATAIATASAATAITSPAPTTVNTPAATARTSPVPAIATVSAATAITSPAPATVIAPVATARTSPAPATATVTTIPTATGPAPAVATPTVTALPTATPVAQHSTIYLPVATR